jgi:hypothetical protein
MPDSVSISIPKSYSPSSTSHSASSKSAGSTGIIMPKIVSKDGKIEKDFVEIDSVSNEVNMTK